MTLHGALQERGLEVLAFPCNQFGYQEPKGAEDVEACVRARYGVGFTIMEKVHVNGAQAHPAFAFLKARLSDVLPLVARPHPPPLTAGVCSVLR